MNTTVAAPTTQIYRVFINASPERVWEAVTDPAQIVRYFHGAHVERELHAGGMFRSSGPDGATWIDGSVLECDPPKRFVHTWQSLYDPDCAVEAASRVTWEIEPKDGGYCMLTVTHDQLEGAPKTAASVEGPGWMFVLSNLKTLVETGDPITDFA